jgi:hypothetical protein
MTTNLHKRYPKRSSNHELCHAPSTNMRNVLLLTAALFNLTQSFSISSTPPTPNHDLTGEFLVQTQLSHYKTSNIPKIYDLCSPWFQDVTGSLDDFEEAINTPPYNLLLNHERADIMLETIPDTPKNGDGLIQAACYLVYIKPGKDAASPYPVWFWWEVSRHFLEDDDLNDDEAEGEWKVDCIMPDFDDLDFEAESLAQDLSDNEDDEDEEDGFTFFMDFGDDRN